MNASDIRRTRVKAAQAFVVAAVNRLPPPQDDKYSDAVGDAMARARAALLTADVALVRVVWALDRAEKE